MSETVLDAIAHGLHVAQWQTFPKDGSSHHRGSTQEFAKGLEELFKGHYDGFRQAGLYSAGFLFASTAISGGAVFYSSTEDERPQYKTPYIWDQPGDRRFSLLLHHVFVMVRDRQQSPDERTEPEYYHYLRLAGPESSPPPDRFCHYCRVGEMLYYLIAWRWLARKRAAGPGDDAALSLAEWEKTWSIQGDLIRGYLEKVSVPENDPSLAEDWEASMARLFPSLADRRAPDWQDELRALRLHPSQNDPAGAGGSRLASLSKHLGLQGDLQALTVERLTEALDVALVRDQKINLDALSNWPLPVTGFYLWNALNASPVTYLVRPVWASRRFARDYRAGSQATSVVGLALCGVRPLDAFEDAPEVGERFSARDIFRFLAECSLPAVEINFYDVLHDQSLRSRKKVATAAIMSRNFSHNVGSHSLGNPHLHRSIGILELPDTHAEYRAAIEQRLSTFHAYAQGRLDFLARAISETGSTPEPLFFLSDVFEGKFLRQGVLLDTLIEDAGFAAGEIEFHVEIEKTEAGEFDRLVFVWGHLGTTTPDDPEKRHRFVRREQDARAEDALVGVPGGTIGAHALYAFLENVMRNAVKYGARLRDGRDGIKLQVHLRLERGFGLRGGIREPAWVLSIWDNVSRDDDGEAVRTIRGHLHEQLVDEDTGATVATGHGIQEMKLCAELLSGGEKGYRFPADDSDHPRAGLADDEYRDFLGARGDGEVLASGTPQALHCYHATRQWADDAGNPSFSQEDRWLTYSLLIPIPAMLGVVLVASGQPTRDQLPPQVRYFKSVADLAGQGVHLAVLLDHADLRKEEVLAEIAQFHPRLPFRLMIVSNGEAAPDSFWQTELQRRQQKPGEEDFELSKHIPARRVRLCTGERASLLHRLLSTPSASGEETYLGAGGAGNRRWDAIVLRVYNEWLVAYKGSQAAHRAQPPALWNVCIGFDHGGEKVTNRWKTGLEAFTEESGACIAISVVAKRNRSDGDPSHAPSPNFQPLSEDRMLVFDNHDCFAVKPGELPFGQGSRFGQKIGLADGLSLYQSLETPPSSPFAFAVFAYQIAEGALTEVAIVDERVAQATLDPKGRLISAFATRRHLYNSARIFPFYTLSRGGRSARLSLRIDDALRVTLESPGTDAAEWKSCWEGVEGEGVHLEDKSVRLAALVQSGRGAKDVVVSRLEGVDVLIFHEGVADRMHSQRGRADEPFWEPADTQKLFCCAPFLVRTSGRGQESRYLHKDLPFMEFTEVSENTYVGLNKVSLVKALLSSQGGNHGR